MSRNFEKIMKDSLPEYYDNSKTVNGIIETESAEFNDLAVVFWDVLMQAFVDTASWGLDRWEKNYGIESDETKTLEERRAAIKSKMRGQGTVTKQTLLSLMEPFGVGDVVIDENHANYSIDITFVGTRGEPENLEEINAALKVFIPAHLGLQYNYTYITWGELEGQTWDEIQFQEDGTNRTWKDVETSFFS